MAGIDRFSTFPDFVKRAGLGRRFAVVQDTYVEGCVDMYFDEPLWRTLAEFVRSRATSGRVDVTSERGRAKSASLDDFLQEWAQIPAVDQEPPPVLTAYSGSQPTLCMVTDYWTRVGGPRLYHDSYTYSFFSSGDVGLEVMAAMAVAPASGRWKMASEVTTVTWTPPPSLTRRLKAWLTGTMSED